jgi:hypothetical protein
MKADEIFPGRQRVPGMHALIVGVSDYPHLLGKDDEAPDKPHHLGLRKLSTAAIAAHRLYGFLVERADNLAVPLSTCRILLSPAPQDKLAGFAPRATLADFQSAAVAWRNDARTDPRNMTLFYFAGHGLQRTTGRGQVLLFDGFGANEAKILQGCLEASNLLDGMASMSASDTMAHTQLYFFDACRTLPDEVQKYDQLHAETIWDSPPLPDGVYQDDRLAPMFYTPPGSQAFGIEDVGSVFGEALIRCLRGGAGKLDQQTRQWSVTVNSLNEALAKQLMIVNREYGIEQGFRVSELGRDALLHQLDGAPQMPVEITLDPPDKRIHAKIFVSDEKENAVFDLGAPVPELDRREVQAGTYEVTAIPDVRLLADGEDLKKMPRKRTFERADPPFSTWPLSLE